MTFLHPEHHDPRLMQLAEDVSSLGLDADEAIEVLEALVLDQQLFVRLAIIASSHASGAQPLKHRFSEKN